MISWMQKNNKYLVVTIWIATIAFIGAGFVGWGTYQYGKKATAIAQVGDIEISQEKFDFTYRNLYRKYSNIFKGQFDDKKAKEMQLPKIAFSQLASQALLLNLAKEYGIVVSDEELAKYITSMPYFQNSGRFDKQIYQTFLENNALTAKSFEKILREDLIIQKLMRLMDKRALEYEKEVIASALNIEDRLSYTILLPSDINITIDEADIKEFWQKNKNNYLTKKRYKLSILWTNLDDIDINESDLINFYHRNSYNYLDNSGKELPFEKVKELVKRDYLLKKGKKRALKDYIAFKKGKKEASEVVEIDINAPKLSKELWSAIETANKGSIIKPKPVGSKYATVKIEDIIEPKVMSFEEAKEQVTKDYKQIATMKALDKEAKLYIDGKKKFKNTTEFISASNPTPIKGLSEAESLQFFKKLFTSNKQIGMITLSNMKIVYRVSEQRIGKSNKETIAQISSIADDIKSSDLSDNLIKELSKRYKIQKFVKGI